MEHATKSRHTTASKVLANKDLRGEVLKLFTHHLIINSHAAPSPKVLPRVEMPVQHIATQMISASLTAKQMEQGYETLPGKITKIRELEAPMPANTPALALNPEAKQKPSLLDTLTSYMQRPDVESIECSGSGKNLVLHTKTGTTTIPLQLSKTEIEDTLHAFANKAGTSPADGLVKAKVGNMLITGVFSEFIDGRFIIQRH